MESISTEQREVIIDALEQIKSAFDIDTDIISEVINNDLEPLLVATNFFIENV